MPFFIGGGGQCDVYGFTVPAGTILEPPKPGARRVSFLDVKTEAENAQPQAKICLRIPRDYVLPDDAAHMIRLEVAWRTKIKEAGLGGLQRMIHHDLTSDNAINSPYIALEWADGKQLKWHDTMPQKQEDREKVIKQVVELTMGFLRISEEGISARAYMQNLVDVQINRIVNPGTDQTAQRLHTKAQQSMLHFSTKILSLTPSAAQMLDTHSRLLDKHIIPELDTAPHVLIHGDLGEGNIIIDNDHNVTLIDLGFMHLEPLQLAAYFPRFLTHEPSSVDEDCPFDGRMEGKAWVRGWGQQDTEQMAKDRKWYKKCVWTVTENEQDERTKSLMRLYARVLEREDEVERFWWMQAMQRVDIWLQMERCGWEPRKGREKKDENERKGVVKSKPNGAASE